MYFLIWGIAGVNTYQGTTGTAAFARFTIQVALQYEIDAREIPSNWTTGYFPLGTYTPQEYPESIYGTEVFELNVHLRDRTIALAANVPLNDSSDAIAYRAKYDYAPANRPPKIVAGDSVCSDVYYSGPLLGEAFGNITTLVTNGSGVYVMTAEVKIQGTNLMVGRQCKLGSPPSSGSRRNSRFCAHCVAPNW
jgi:purine nucleoside permease